MKIIALSVLMLATLVSQQVLAWGQIGHRVTGAIAEQYLSPEAKKQVEALLPNECLAEASTWPDDMRSNPAKFWRKESVPLHYITVPKGKHYTDVGAPEEGDAVTAIHKFTKALKNPNTSRKEKQLALRFLVHLIGDLHQPLHVGNGTDRGGNDINVEFFWQDSNLHRVWDNGLIDRKQLSYSEWSEWLLRKITPQQAKQWSVTDPQVWIAESVLLRDGLYPKKKKLSWDYLYQHTPTIKLRLQQAGVRIATYLNEIYAK